MKLTEKRTPAQIAQKVIWNGRPFETRFARGFRWGRLKLEFFATELNLYAGKGEWDASHYLHQFPNSGQGRSVRNILRRALPY